MQSANAAAMPLARKAATFSFCQTCKSLLITIAIFVSNLTTVSLIGQPSIPETGKIKRLQAHAKCDPHEDARGSMTAMANHNSNRPKTTHLQKSVAQTHDTAPGRLACHSLKTKPSGERQ